MIKLLQLENFKRHADTTLRLSPLTVLVGPNGAGKTSVLEALLLLSQIHYKPLGEVLVGSPHSVVRRGTHHTSVLAAGTEADQSRFLGLRIDAVSAAEGDEFSESVEWDAFATLDRQTNQNQPKFPVKYSALRERLSGPYWPHLQSAVMLRLDARRVAAPSLAEAGAKIEFDGGKLPTVLANLNLEEAERFARIGEDLRRLIPQFRALRARPQGSGFELYFDTDSGKNIRASEMSEGTLLMLALLTVLHSKQRPRLLLLDDVHEALHPKAQMALMKLLQELVMGPDSIQIIATTHSPYIVDYVEAEAVLVFAQTPDGSSLVRSLAQHPEYERMKGRISAGQLWTLDDELVWMSEVQP